MAIPLDSFEVQSESPVDFTSLKRNEMDLESLITFQMRCMEVFYLLPGTGSL